MLYRFRAIDPDREDFMREYEISPGMTFYDFHTFLVRDLSLPADAFCSFFMAGEQWEKGLELTIFDMDNETELAAIPMSSVSIGEIAREVGARFIYTYDLFHGQSLYFQLQAIDGAGLAPASPVCVHASGSNPEVADDIVELANRDIEELLALGMPSADDGGAALELD